MIRLLIVDDNDAFGEAFVRLLAHQPDIEVVARAGSLAEAREVFSGIDVAIIDRGLPDGDGLELISELRQVSPCVGVLVFSVTLEHMHPGEALGAGAEEVLDKLATPKEIVGTIRRVAGG